MTLLPRMTAEAFEARRADDEAAAIAAERIRSGAADHKEDGVDALGKLGIRLPLGMADEASREVPVTFAEGVLDDVADLLTQLSVRAFG